MLVLVLAAAAVNRKKPGLEEALIEGGLLLVAAGKNFKLQCVHVTSFAL